MRVARPAGWKWPDSVLWAIVALLGAGALIVYLQQREIEALNRQRTLILEQTSEQAAKAVATDIRRTFEAPVFETLAAVNHPLLRSGRFDLVAREFADGLAAYPQVDRFFIWHELTERAIPGEALFFGGKAADDDGVERFGPAGGPGAMTEATAAATSLRLDGFYRDAPFGRVVLDVARDQARSQWIYGAAERRVGASSYDLFVQIFWIDANRERFFAVMGYVVSHDAVRHRLFEELYRRKLAALLEPSNGDGGPLQLRILDEQGQVAFGPADPPGDTAGRAPFALRFYPADEIRMRMAGEVRERIWHAVVTPSARSAAVAPSGARGFWLSGASIFLMILALALALRGRQRASQLSRMQAEFVSHVSHQLKTPLSLLCAVTETLDLERVRSPQKLAEYVGMIRTETDQLSLLVDRILEFSRVQGRRVYELEPVDLIVLARETVEAFDRALPGATIRVEVQGGPVVVAADSAAMEQVLANLLDNAVKYSPGEKAIVVTVGRVGREATVEVRDNGIGISPGERSKIFDRFYRGSGATLHRQGFGLGLAIVREIVTAHHGRIEIESERGRGTTFRVRLPLLARKDGG